MVLHAVVDAGVFELVPVELRSKGMRARVLVTADSVKVGRESPVRVTTSHRNAQRIADLLGLSLLTSKVADACYLLAVAKASPCPMNPDAESRVMVAGKGLVPMSSPTAMIEHDRQVTAKLAGTKPGLSWTTGKDWVNSNRFVGHQYGAHGSVNYGWHDAKGPHTNLVGQRLWQPLGAFHNWEHDDYSQGMRFMVPIIELEDGRKLPFDQVARDPELCGLVSDEGQLAFTRHPGVARPTSVQVPVEKLSELPPPQDPGKLARGSKGPEVVLWQEMLVEMGFGNLLAPFGADGDFGSKTEGATEAWQLAAGLKVTGIVTDSDLERMRGELEAKVKKGEKLEPPLPVDDEPTREILLGKLPPIAFKQAKNYTKVSKRKVDLIVIHTMEAAEKPTTAEAVAAWFAGKDAPKASAHYSLDQDSIVQSVKDKDVAWAAPGANHNGLQLEHAGYAAQTGRQWEDPSSRSMLELSALLTAELCRDHGIPAEYVDAKGLQEGQRGITTHAQVSVAFRKSTHSDPGKNFPMAWYLGRVRAYLDRG